MCLFISLFVFVWGPGRMRVILVLFGGPQMYLCFCDMSQVECKRFLFNLAATRWRFRQTLLPFSSLTRAFEQHTNFFWQDSRMVGTIVNPSSLLGGCSTGFCLCSIMFCLINISVDCRYSSEFTHLARSAE